MKWYKLIAPTAIGLTVGTIIGKKVKDRWLFPEVALKKVKESFKENGPISGSWILMELKELKKDDELIKVYRGGVSRNIDGQTIQYEFYVDAANGEIVEINHL
ncbi:peptidase M4 [Filobacillus milosensis]|uniref:Peptidase M4 n=1 Tax=Filobacillus milosensis TaxID=94137 RepID=A0A4Y8IT98_9BACI|nr:PepSY domain-containing protein [Filobacillus milosensis]TFB25084.1 peptidase M4 [Filobacillus milosensis]